MTDEPLASRSFSLDDQIAFARLSSDWNPMHLDEAFARRTQVGRARGARDSHPRLGGGCRAAPLSPQDRQHPRQISAAAVPRRTASIRIRDRSDRQIEFEVVAANTVVALIRLSSEPGKSPAEARHRRRRRLRRCRSLPISASNSSPIRPAPLRPAMATSDRSSPRFRDSIGVCGRQGAARDVADCRHGVPGTALAVCRAAR